MSTGHDEEGTFSRESFRENLADAVDPGSAVELSDDTCFRELETWDSIASVSVVAMIYAEYDVQVSGDELVGCETAAQLAALVQGKLSS